jgi:mannose-1-phosphate guanylyltransferase
VRFVEKPDRARAEQFLVQGGHVWNLGMFAWRADAFLAELATHIPATANAIAAAGPALGTPREEAALAAAYADLPSISVDHGVLEKSQNVEVVRCSFLWDDMGSFAACGRHLPKDDNENCSLGPLVAVDAHNNIAYAEDGRMTAILGVNDLVVVHAHGVTLVAPRSRAEEVKKLVDALGPAGLERFR